jgi:PadR family transcriptional regulator
MIESLPVIRGTLDMLVLKALTWRDMHGFEITRWLESQSRRRLALEDAALYQSLYRLEERGLVEAEWGVTDNNRRARYYRITRLGKKDLANQTSTWLRYAQTLTELLTEEPE